MDLFRGGVSADIEIFRGAVEQQVAYPAADQTGTKTGPVQPVHDFQRVGADIATRYAVLGARDNRRLYLRVCCIRHAAVRHLVG